MRPRLQGVAREVKPLASLPFLPSLQQSKFMVSSHLRGCRRTGWAQSNCSSASLQWVFVSSIVMAASLVTDGKESACNVGDPGLIPGSGRPAWRREWQPTTVFLPGEFHGQRSLEGYSTWGHKESDTTEVTNIMNLPLYYECHTLLHLFITTICEVDTR